MLRALTSTCEKLAATSLIEVLAPRSRMTQPRGRIQNLSPPDIEALFERLKSAKRQVRALKSEINEINEQVEILVESDIFKKHLDSALTSSSDEGDFGFNPGLSNSPLANAKRGSSDDSTNGSSELCKRRKISNFVEECGNVVVYTDGACENNGRANAKAGIGVWFGDNHPLNVSMPVKGKATNNTAEIQACIKALEVARQNSINKLTLRTDSQFTINCITKWMNKWKKNNWTLAGGGEVKNKIDLKKLDELCKSVEVKWEHVAGHKGIKGNEEADKLAREGALRYKP